MRTKRSGVIYILLFFSLVSLVGSCAPKPVVVPEAEPGAAFPGAKLLEKAERYYQNEKYQSALAQYQKYLEQYPDGRYLDLVLLRLGNIYNIQKQYGSAQEVFERLLSRLPESDYRVDAKIGILAALYGKGDYDEVVRLASVALEESKTDDHQSRINEILGDTYVSLGSPEDSVPFYSLALQKADQARKDPITEKLTTSINLLEPARVESLLQYLEEEPARGYLKFRLALGYAEENRFDDALSILSEFISEYPDRPEIPQARELLDDLAEKAFYNRTTIGCVLPLSGNYKVYGSRAMNGIELAMARYNRSVENPVIQLVIKDSGSKPEELITAVEALAQEKVAAIIGPLVNAEYAAAIAQEKGIPIVTFTQKENITDIGDKVFRNFLTHEMQVRRLVSYATETLSVKNFAILYPDEKYGSTFMNLFWDEVIQHNGKVVAVESYDPSHTDFADSIKKLVGLYYDVPEDLQDIVRPPQEPKEDDPAENNELEGRRGREEETLEPIVDFEAVFIPDGPKKTGLIVPQLAFYDIEEVYLLGSNLWHSPRLIQMAQEYVQGAIMPDGFFADSTSERVQQFVRMYETTYGNKPGVIEATAFDTAMMLFQIVSRPDVLSRNAIRDALLATKFFPGVTGLTSFDEKGDALKEPTLLRIERNRFVELE